MSEKRVDFPYNTLETANGYKISKMYNNCTISDSMTEIFLDIDLFGHNNEILKTVSFVGSLNQTVKTIKSFFTEDIEIIINDCKRVYKLNDNEKPLYKCFYKENQILKPTFKTFIYAKLKEYKHIQLSNHIKSVYLLRKLIIENLSVNFISIITLKFLKYLKIINCDLKSISRSFKLLEYCNLRNNSLINCPVLSKVLILRSNKIEKFSSELNFKYLNLSDNPLKIFKGSAKFLNISNTLIKSPLSCDSEVILADCVKKIKIKNCPNMKVLSVNDCKLTKIGSILINLKIFKARNNYFQSLPKLNKCTVIDVAGNFLDNIKSSNVIYLDISKNQIREINLRKYSSVQHLNISFNPLERIFNEEFIKQPKTILINESMVLDSSKIKYKDFTLYDCEKCSSIISQFKLEILIDHTPTIIFILLKSNIKNNYEKLITHSIDRYKHLDSFLDIFFDFSDYLYRSLAAKDRNVKVSFTFITNKYVFLRSFFLPIFFFNFAEMDFLSNPKNMRIFNNASNWCTFPVFCKYKRLPTFRCYSLFKYKADCVELFQFNDLFCPKILEFYITNKIDYFITDITYFKTNCTLIKEIYSRKYNGTFMNNLQKLILNESNPRHRFLGLNNIDFDINNMCLDSELATFTTNNPVFLYLKLFLKFTGDQIIHVEELNLVHIIEFYLKIFGGRTIEKNYNLFIAGFNNPLYSALFGLQIQKILKSVGIEVGIGISGDVIFRTVTDDIVYFGGPVLNKSSRIADLGVGVYCCGCIKISSPLIEMIDEGERYLKGFNKRHKIYTLRYTGLHVKADYENSD